MAAQLGLALGAAFLVGHLAFGRHWPWVVITAYIVSSGNRGRGDVVYKGILRLVGAAVGTVAATLLAGAFPPGDDVAIVAIFAVLAVGTWLRSISYAYWAGCVTAMLSLLYGYFGQTGASLLGARMAGIGVGAVIAVAAAWLLLPIRTTDVLRRRTADALAALTDFLAASRGDPAGLGPQQARFDHAVAQLEQIAPPLTAYRLLARRLRPGPHLADTIDGVRRCAKPVRTIARYGTAHPDALAQPEIAQRGGVVAVEVGALRRALAGRGEQSRPAAAPATGDGTGELDRAFADLGTAVTALAASLPAVHRSTRAPARAAAAAGAAPAVPTSVRG
jgi:uncharacterized membrane protein YccC